MKYLTPHFFSLLFRTLVACRLSPLRPPVACVSLSVWTLDVRRQTGNRQSMRFVVEGTFEVRMVMRRIIGTGITKLVLLLEVSNAVVV